MHYFLTELQSTPARRDVKKNRQSVSLANISPILAEEIKQQNSSRNVDKFVDVEIEDYIRTSPPRVTERQISNPSGINHELREKQRRSLANFEEFENTLLILENNKNEEEFDDLLNTFSANIRNPLSQKVRQSLDNIKKRHSFLGQEKQQQDELNREKTMNMSQIEKNRINESFNRTAMVSSTSSSGSGSGERLLRRSRLFDDVINTSGIPDVNELHTSSSGSSIGINDNRHEQTENRRNTEGDVPQLKTDKTMIYNTEDGKSEGKSSNRDRFKTIRIFKKPPDNAVQVPDADDEPSIEQMKGRTFDAFATKNTNSPTLSNQYEDDQNNAKAINTMTFKRSALARPNQLSGLNKRDSYAKSNSHEHLLSNDHSSKIQSKPVTQLKSPMGIKSKSIHNLSTTKSNIAPPSRMNTQPSVSFFYLITSQFLQK